MTLHHACGEILIILEHLKEKLFELELFEIGNNQEPFRNIRIIHKNRYTKTLHF